MTKTNLLATTGLVLAVSAATAQAATTIFFEDFAEELASIAPANTAGNFTGLDSFTIVNGSVDLFGNGGYSLSCQSAGCLDLDGSTSDAARLESTALSFVAGVTYTLEFTVSGNQRGRANDTLEYGLTGLLNGPLTLTGNDSFQTITRTFTMLADATASIYFDHAGGDNYGIILDSVTVTADTPAVPLPASLPLLGAGLAGLVAMRRRKG
ncbi:hypothetical protein RGUI_3740 [Rhodovulum sp. P5]|uniref:VPLPA-CTERM sorting domain-containing protein n=1 Tax=Rhodovulum sp. P5 TaxID=1564506 RepID=UPI0009C2CF56|nr:VPLPA-CTERM sorting domain-containing protein [Rhodovulum sp. P5]ARE41881.1 hypothetical protein RGUI_3740 [Rhodovulum sp. P5]